MWNGFNSFLHGSTILFLSNRIDVNYSQFFLRYVPPRRLAGVCCASSAAELHRPPALVSGIAAGCSPPPGGSRGAGSAAVVPPYRTSSPQPSAGFRAQNLRRRVSSGADYWETGHDCWGRRETGPSGGRRRWRSRGRSCHGRDRRITRCPWAGSAAIGGQPAQWREVCCDEELEAIIGRPIFWKSDPVFSGLWIVCCCGRYRVVATERRRSSHSRGGPSGGVVRWGAASHQRFDRFLLRVSGGLARPTNDGPQPTGAGS